MAETWFGVRGAAAAVSLVAALVLSAGPGLAGNKPASDLDCLALNIYFEARGEPLQGKLAVGYVVIMAKLVASEYLSATVSADNDVHAAFGG